MSELNAHFILGTIKELWHLVNGVEHAFGVLMHCVLHVIVVAYVLCKSNSVAVYCSLQRFVLSFAPFRGSHSRFSFSMCRYRRFCSCHQDIDACMIVISAIGRLYANFM